MAVRDPVLEGTSPPSPGVSICVSTHDGAAWVEEALGSALGQTRADLEVVVVDDSSQDETVELLLQIDDPRVRIHRNPVNVGEYATWNRCIALARAPLVKFLCQDDRLRPEAVEELAAPFAASERVGFAFARRAVLLPADATDEQREWAARAEEGVGRLAPLEPINDGAALLERALADGFRGNPFGEPSSVMVRRSCFERLGGFSTRPRQMGDFEVWLRLCAFYDVAFVDRVLSDYRVHPPDGSSVTAITVRSGRDWLDELWLLEGLLEYEAVRRAHPRLGRLRWIESAAALRRAGRRARSNGWRLRPQEAAAARAYLAFRARSARGRAPLLHPPVPSPATRSGSAGAGVPPDAPART